MDGGYTQRTSMRLARALRFLLLLSLALALFGGEVVESACFVDDISNDYIAAPTSSVYKSSETATARAISPPSIKMAVEWISTPTTIPFTELARSSGLELLRLLSIQRK